MKFPRHLVMFALLIVGTFVMSRTAFAVNSAPVLDATKSPVLSTLAEDPGAPAGAVGSLVNSLIDFASPSGQVDNVTDVDGGSIGIALIATDNTLTCYYSLNGGSTWTATGSVSDSSARLLAADADNRIRCYHQAPD